MKTASRIERIASLRALRAALVPVVCWLCAFQNALAFPPQITTQPTNQTVQVGSNATFVVGATTSNGALTYQWYFQSTPIAGATTNTYTRTNVQLTHAGAYYVAVTNADGGFYSTNAILTVGTYPGLKGHWPLDANANDFSGNNYTGTLTNGADIDTNSPTANIGAGKVSLDGVNDYVDLSAHRSAFMSMSEGTIAAWIRTTESQGGTIFDIANTAVANSYATLWLFQGRLTFSVESNSVVQLDFEATPAVNNNVWHHVAVTMDATGNKLYIDGVHQTSLNYVTGNPTTQKFFNSITGHNFMAIGTDRNNSGLRDMFAGLIDDVRVYYGALTPGDIAGLAAMRGPDVATTVSGPTSVFATTNFTYTISVANSFATASNIVVSDSLPAGINVVSVSGGGIVVGCGPGQVVFDSVSSNHVSGVTNWTHITTTAANRLMLVGISIEGSGTVSNITYGGLNLTKVKSAANIGISAELWQLPNPPAGTHSVSVTLGGTPDMFVAGAATFSGVDQSTPLSATNATLLLGNTTFNTINSATNEIVFDNLVYDKNGNPTPGAGQTRLWEMSASGNTGGASLKPGTNSVNMSWDIPFGLWADIAASVKAAPLIGVVYWTIPTLASGATTNFTVTVTAPLSGALSNTVSSTSTTTDASAENNNGSAANARIVTTVVPVADVVTTVTGPTSIATLTNYTYTVTVSNAGPSTASRVVVSDTLSPTITYVSSTGGGSYLAGVVTWPALNLAKNATTNFTVAVRSPISGMLTNIASSTSATADSNLANNNGSVPAAQVSTAVSPLQIANTSYGANVQTLNWSHTVSPGSSRILIVGISIDNTNATVNSATFNNILPLTLIGQTNGAQTRVLMYRLLNPPTGTYAVSINLNSAVGVVGGACSFNGVDQANPVTAFVGNKGNGSNATVTVSSALGGVVIDAVAPKSPQNAINPGAGQTAEWNLSASNYSGAGSSSYGSASVTPTWSLNSPTNWTAAAVSLKSATILADVTVSATGSASVPATSNLTYSITVTNLGLSSSTNVVVSDVLPAGAIFVSASSGGTSNAGFVSWPALTNFVNGARTNYTVTIKAPVVGTLTNIVYCTAVTADPDPSNNNGTGAGNQVVTIVTPLADVATTVTGPAGVFATTAFSYTVIVTNAGPSPADNVLVSDTLPVGVTFVGASDDGFHNTGVVTWSLASLASGAAVNYTVTVTAPVSGSLTNTVASTSAATDPLPSNNDGSASGAQGVTAIYPIPTVSGQRLPSGHFQMEFNTIPGATCAIEVSTNLVDWVTLITTNSGLGQVIFVDQDTTNYPVRFYRSRQEP